MMVDPAVVITTAIFWKEGNENDQDEKNFEYRSQHFFTLAFEKIFSRCFLKEELLALNGLFNKKIGTVLGEVGLVPSQGN